MNNIAIFGFGRIGRQLLRVALENELFVPVSISDIKDEATLAALFEVDTNYKRWPEPVAGTEGTIRIGDRSILYLNSSQEIPNWSELGVGLVIDCTGRAVTRQVAELHLERGAKRVLVSGPSKTLDDCDAVLLKGINLDSFDPDKHKIISMASCTTNALAPVVKLVRENFGIQYGLFSTVHSYTNTQSLTDQPMRDRRDSWAAAENIIPSSSGAAKALKFIWPDLQITGKAYRIPTRTGSIAELNLVTEKPCTAQEINDMFRKAAQEGPLNGVLDVLEGEWASSRIVGDSHSSIIDLPLTHVQGGLLSVAAWYDNEWGYASRLAEVAAFLGRQ
ncbi:MULTISPECIES: glyceraldehyde 3-phosphate dehydrogenase NAD-binding domain-containing protein [unclassified Paenibacillus]|uniref:type I glyceraldehyde-3-phosphate dehydrogenase n=1 Tax=unclassified Paenibacillus TaxID=185978 RepID=UPI00104A2169|nr:MULTISPECIES: glyceraldehyde 3-phosphate dehydrogenase NAD-binding domain-containing protein [unclassified Paenibacillus]NIK67021.1 glyceraldehyde 3-phosphate dehydrogenase [Paenibacillus sp. BK720]TCN01073.1 glyceraldehyde 3-phosphate dehydrogenase [Paenibacillus sp. BK033]